MKLRQTDQPTVRPTQREGTLQKVNNKLFSLTEEEYANRAVDLDASESEEEEYRPRGGAAANTELQTKPEQATQNGGSSNVEVLGTMKDDDLPKHSKQSVNDEIAGDNSFPYTIMIF